MAQAVRPFTHIHPCPICRLPYNIAPLDPKGVPPTLPFVTPSVRKVFFNTPSDIKEDEKTSPSSSLSSSPPQKMNAERSDVSRSQSPTTAPLANSSGTRDFNTTSEITRLRAENQALRNHCAMWRRRAEIHGEANLGLLKFARAMRDQMSQLARDRNELEERCLMLKKMLDGDCDYENEMEKYRSKRPTTEANTEKAATHDDATPGPDRDSSKLPPLISFAPSADLPMGQKQTQLEGKRPLLVDDEDSLEGSRKRLKLSDLLAPHESVGITISGVDSASNLPSYLEGRRRSV